MDSTRLRAWKKITKERNKLKLKDFNPFEYIQNLENLTKALVDMVKIWEKLPKKERTKTELKLHLKHEALIKTKMIYNIHLLELAAIPLRYVNSAVKRLKPVVSSYYPHRQNNDVIINLLYQLIQSLTGEGAFEVFIKSWE